MKLRLQRLDQCVVAGQLAEIYTRFGDRQIHLGHRRQVPNKQHGLPGRCDLVDRPQRQSVAVRKRQPFIHPRSVRQALTVELTQRQHHLAVLAVDGVAVVVNVHKIVVGPDLLDLGEGLQQRLMIPQADVFNGAGIGRDVGRRQRAFTRQFPLLHPIERVRLARGLDVVPDEGFLLGLFVRRHDKPLHKPRVDTAGRGDNHVGDDDGGKWPALRPEPLPQSDQAREAQHHQRHTDEGDARIHIRV